MSSVVQIATAIMTKLKGDTNLTSLLTTYASLPAVFTHVPQDLNTYPYVVLYETGLDGNDNDAHLGFDGVLNIHCWTDERDMAVIGNIQNAIYNALHNQELTMTGYNLGELHQEFTTILRDPDGITLHGVQRFRIILQTN